MNDLVQVALLGVEKRKQGTMYAITENPSRGKQEVNDEEKMILLAKELEVSTQWDISQILK